MNFVFLHACNIIPATNQKLGSHCPCTVIIKLNSGVYIMHETPQGNHYRNWMFKARTEVNMLYDYWAR